jgi:membrane peptidoglycan carboxypeptidase
LRFGGSGVYFSVRHRDVRLKQRECPGSREMVQSRPAPTSDGDSKQRARRWRAWLIAACLVLALAILDEARTSRLQSGVLAKYAARLTYHVAPGPSPRIVFPGSGPHDQQLGYARLPEFTDRLLTRGYRIAEQARMSEATAHLARLGISPPYREKAIGGLVVRGENGAVMFDARPGKLLFERYDEVPSLVVDSLLYIEDRELLGTDSPRHNPAFDWERLSRASLLYLGRGVGLPLPTEGGSTLATQIEKLRHSPGGRTSTPLDKLRQVSAASLKAYRSGPDTLAQRREIVVDYLNSMPLAALPDRGEIRGLGEGLQAWFSLDLDDVRQSLLQPGVSAQKVAAYKAVLALLCAVREPTRLLVQDRAALERRLDAYTRLLRTQGVLSADLADRVAHTPLEFRISPSAGWPDRTSGQKAVAAVRTELLDLLHVRSLYDLDRLDVEVDSTIDVPLQSAVRRLLTNLRDPDFISSHALTGKRLLSQGDPADIAYTVLLYEATPEANLLRVHADSLDRPFDLNTGMKMGLGSTAKLRTLAHYLEVVAQLHSELEGGDLQARRATPDPITAWAQRIMQRDPAIGIEAFLQLALDREYPAEPRRVDFPVSRSTAVIAPAVNIAGIADVADVASSALASSASANSAAAGSSSANSSSTSSSSEDRSSSQNGSTDGNAIESWYIPRSLTVRTALVQSSNRVFIGLMRDLVQYHAARLPYDAQAVMTDPGNPLRKRFLEESADQEAAYVLKRSYQAYRGRTEQELVRAVLRGSVSPRRAAVLFYAWHGDAGEVKLGAWLASQLTPAAQDAIRSTPDAIHRLARAYANPELTIADYGYLLDVHPLQIWCAGMLLREPGISLEELLARDGQARKVSSAWLFETRNRRAQDRRVWRHIERDAFAHMTPYWRRMGFPFEHLVPSVTTALGSSADRPAALAELMGIILNDGWRRPSLAIDELRFADDTPYYSEFRSQPQPGERVMQPAVARLLRDVLAQVVEYGTARPLKAAISGPDGVPAQIGGKTGTDSGDSRYALSANGRELAMPAAGGRTASFAFYIGDHYFGVITASVQGPGVADYRFTSELPLAVLRQLSPLIEQRLATAGARRVRTASLERLE